MEAADAVDHFARIPEELLVLIFSRLENLKYMCACSLVSKRFALTIYQIKSVSLALPSTEIPTDAVADKIDELFLKMAGFSSEEIIRFIQSSPIKELKFLLFLQNFTELRSISLEFQCPRIVCSSSLFKMRVKFSGEGAKVERFVSLVADIVCKESEWGEDDEQQFTRFYSSKSVVTGTFLPLGCCTDWLLVTCLLVKCHPSLVGITITNCKKEGTLVLRDEQLVAWRNSLVPGGFLNDFRPYSCTSGWTCELFMPESGYLLKGVNFVIARLGGKARYDSAKVNDGATIWEYAGDEKLLPDALREFERQYNDPFITSRLSGFI